MRGWVLISVLALAGCGEHMGMNPNYRFGGSPYGTYLAEREAALTTNGDAPSAIPLVRPFKAPTPEQIAGRTPVPVPATMGVRTGAAATAAGSARRPSGNQPLAANDAPYPGSVPALSGFAAATSHAPGQAVYPRNAGSVSQAAQACASFPNPEAAQVAFLGAGGPQADPRGMDPDGDGFVCGWDPRPLRQP